MIEESLLKSNFIGRDGFRWWIGQVAPFQSGTGQEDQNNGGGWGNRQKVRILGYHPFDEQELSNEDLPWAQVLLPTTSGSGAGNVATNTKLRPSDSVFGFFLDGDNAQLPVILGVFGRTSEVSQENYSSASTPPFVPFTGYTSRVEKPNGTLPPDESNEQNTQSQKSPRDVPKEALDSINAEIKALNAANISGAGENQTTSVPLKTEVPYFTGIGTKVTLGNTCEDTAIKGIISEVNNLLGKVTGFQSAFSNIDLEIGRAVSSIKGMTNGLVGQMFRNLGGTLIPSLQEGLGGLYNEVASSYSDEVAGILAAVEAQKAFIEPVFNLQNSLSCSIGEVVNGMDGMIEDLLRSALSNVENFVSCAGTQFVGSLLNGIISKVESSIGPSLEGVSDIVAGGIDIYETLTGGIDAITKAGSLLDCNQDPSKCSGVFTEYVIGKGVKSSEDNAALVSSVLENAKLSAEIGRIGNDIFGADKNGTVNENAGGATGIPECNIKLPRPLDIPEIRIFGGGGSGATGEVILGSFVRNVPKNGQDVNDAQITASIIGVKITNPGEGYKYPPFIEVVDNSKQGYGAIARTIIRNGKLREVYIVSVGENYPVGSTKIDAARVPIVGPGGVVIDPNNLRYNPLAPQYRKPRSITVGIGASVNVGIASLTIIRPGVGYSTGDIVVDPFDIPIVTGFGETIGIKTDSNGGISGFISESPVAILSDEYPEIRVRSLNGVGAEIKASIGIVTSISKLTQIIDCIS
jgi:hypothetical protein